MDVKSVKNSLVNMIVSGWIFNLAFVFSLKLFK